MNWLSLVINVLTRLKMEVKVKKDWNTEAGLEKFEWLAENVKGNRLKKV